MLLHHPMHLSRNMFAATGLSPMRSLKTAVSVKFSDGDLERCGSPRTVENFLGAFLSFRRVTL